MKNSASLVALLVALPSSFAFAADLPSKKELPVTPAAAPTWSGFYAGLNIGGNVGTNGNVSSQNWAGPWTVGSQALSGYFHPGVAYAYGTAPISMDGVRGNTQSGVIGGAQIGYNYQWSSKLVLGAEADIEGSGIRGSTNVGGASTSALYDPLSIVNGHNVSTAAGSSQVQTGIDYIGTVRGRVGYLITPALLIYGTGGFAYGGAWAKVSQTASERITLVTNTTNLFIGNGAWFGGGNQNQILTGWTAGGGAEWMFMPNWSLKGEALYWDLGRMNVNTTSLGSFSPNGNVLGTPNPLNPSIGWGRTSVSYSGVQAKLGVNYHFNFGTAPVVAKF